ncbi:MAG: MarR family winged helix-turn-helix transcriptional regulator [Sporichthyaceae bacterium]
MTDEPRWLDEQEQRAWRGLIAMWTQLNAELARQMAANSELSMAEFAVLVSLTDVCGGRVRAYELARSLQWEKSRLSHQLTRMAKRGLIERDECVSDGRGQFVAVTESGRRAIEAAAPPHVAAVRRLFLDGLTPADLETLTRIAESTLVRIGDPPTPDCSEPAELATPRAGLGLPG